MKEGERRRSKPVKSPRGVAKAREARRRRTKKISLASIESIHAIGLGREEQDQRKRTTVTQIAQQP